MTSPVNKESILSSPRALEVNPNYSGRTASAIKRLGPLGSSAQCVACHKTVYDLEKITIGDNVAFHLDCFRCAKDTCKTKLSRGSFVKVAGKCYCETHGKELEKETAEKLYRNNTKRSPGSPNANHESDHVNADPEPNPASPPKKRNSGDIKSLLSKYKKGEMQLGQLGDSLVAVAQDDKVLEDQPEHETSAHTDAKKSVSRKKAEDASTTSSTKSKTSRVKKTSPRSSDGTKSKKGSIKSKAITKLRPSTSSKSKESSSGSTTRRRKSSSSSATAHGGPSTLRRSSKSSKNSSSTSTKRSHKHHNLDDLPEPLDIITPVEPLMSQTTSLEDVEEPKPVTHPLLAVNTPLSPIISPRTPDIVMNGEPVANDVTSRSITTATEEDIREMEEQLDILVSDLEEAKRKEAKLFKSLEVSEKKEKEKTHRIHKLEKQIDQLEEQLQSKSGVTGDEETQSLIQSLREKIEEQANEIQQLEEKVSLLEEEKNSSSSSDSSSSSSSDTDSEMATNKPSSLSSDDIKVSVRVVEKLEDENSKLANRIRELEYELDELKVNSDGSEQDSSANSPKSVRSPSNSVSTKPTASQEQLRAAERKVAELTRALADAEAKASAATAVAGSPTSSSSLQVMVTRLADKEEEIQNLHKELEQVCQKCEEAEATCSSLRKQVDELSQASARGQTHASEASKLKSERGLLVQKLADREVLVNKLTTSLTQKESSLDSLRTSMERERTLLQEEVARLRKSISDAEGRAVSAAQMHIASKEEAEMMVKRANDRTAEVQRELEELEELKIAESRAASEARAELNAVKADRAKLSEELVETKRQLMNVETNGAQSRGKLEGDRRALKDRLQQMEVAFNEKNNQILQLRAEVQDAESRAEDARVKLEDARVEIASLEDVKEAMLEDMAQARTEKLLAEQQLEQKMKEMSVERANRRAEQQAHEARLAELDASLQNAEAAKAELASEVTRLQLDIGRMEEEKSTLGQLKNSLESDSGSLRERLKTVTFDRDELAAQIKHYKEKVAKARTKSEELQEQLSQTTREFREAESGYRERLEELEEERAQLLEQLREAAVREADMEGAVSRAQETERQVEEELQDLRLALDTSKRDLLRAREERDAAVASAHAEIDQIGSDKKALMASLTQAAEAEVKLEEITNEARAALMEKEEELRLLRETKLEVEEERAQILAQITDAAAREYELEQECERLVEENKSLRSNTNTSNLATRLMEMETKYAEANERVRELQERLRASEQALELSQNQIEHTRSKLNALHGENEDLKDKLEELGSC